MLSSLCSPRYAFAVLALVVLAACDNSGAQTPVTVIDQQALLNEREAQVTTISMFATPNFDGTFETDKPSVVSRSYNDGGGTGYAFQLGGQDTDFEAFAGVLRSSTVAALPTSGTAAMNGGWQLAQIGRSDGASRDFGEAALASGRITLNVNFEHGILSGTNEGFIVDGSFSGPQLSGSIFYNGRAATLTGLIGADKAIGAFHDANEDSALAGGFYAQK